MMINAESILDLSGVGMFSHDRTSEFLSIDARTSALLGVKPEREQLISVDRFCNLFHKVDIDRMKADMAKHATVYGRQDRVLSIKKDGKLRWVRFTFVTHCDELIDKTEGIVTDCTDEILLKKEREQHLKEKQFILEQKRQLSDFAGVGQIAALTKTPWEINSAARRLLDLPESRFPTLSFNDYLSRIHPDERAAASENADAAKAQHTEYQTTRRFLLPSGETRQLRLNVSPFYSQKGERLGDLLTLVDLTELVDARAKALQKSEEATKLLEQLVQTQAQQEMLFAVLGHELRTPAAAITMALSDALQNDNFANIREAHQTAEHLLSVLEDLRFVSRSEEFTLSHPAPTVVSTLLAQSVAMLRPIGLQNGVRVELETSAECDTHYQLHASEIRRVVTNLCKNAILHSNGDEVWIRAKATASGGKAEFNICIEDNGDGLGQLEFEKLIEPFQRGNSKAPGTGLGLFICKNICNALPGALAYRERSGGGSVFEIRFEAKQSAEPSSQVERVNFDQHIKVMIVEDNPMIRKLTEEIVAKCGANTTVATDGLEALTELKRTDFDLIITDIFMPNMNGYDFVHTAREIGYDGPIIGVTAATIGNEADMLLQKGADRVIAKPITREKLVNAYRASKNSRARNLE